MTYTTTLLLALRSTETFTVNGDEGSNYWEEPEHGDIISVTIGVGGDDGEIFFDGTQVIEIDDNGSATVLPCPNPDTDPDFADDLGSYISLNHPDEGLETGVAFEFRISRGMTKEDLL